MDRSLDSVIENNRKRKAPGSIDLGVLIRPSKLPRDKYAAVQRVLDDQDGIISERGAEIRDRCTQIHNLKSDLAEARADNELYRTRVEQHHEAQKGSISAHELRESKQYYENYIREQDQIMELGRKVLSDKTAKMVQIEEENRSLKAVIDDRDRRIHQLSIASPNELVEAQAQRTLGMVRGLQNDIAERDSQLSTLKSQNATLTTDNNTHKTQHDTLTKAVAAHKNGLQFANKQAAEAKAITEDQAKLIQRLMEENARLAANQRT